MRSFLLCAVRSYKVLLKLIYFPQSRKNGLTGDALGLWRRSLGLPRAPAEGAEENLHPQILIFSSAPQEAEPNGQPPSYPLRVAFPAKSGNSLDHTRQQKARERLTGLVCSRGALQEN